MNRAKPWIIVDEANQPIKDGEFAKLLRPTESVGLHLQTLEGQKTASAGWYVAPGQRGAAKQTLMEKVALGAIDLVAEANVRAEVSDFAALEERVLDAMRNDPQAYQDAYSHDCGLKPMSEDNEVQAMLSQVEKTTGQKSTLVIVGPGVSSDTLMALRRAGLEVRDSLDEPRVQEVGFPLKHAGGGKSKGPRDKWGKVK